MAFGFFKRAKDPEEIALDLEKRFYKQKNFEQAIALFGGIEDQEVLARLYRKIGGSDRMLGFGAEEKQEALLSRITDQKVLAGFLLEGQPERRTDESTRCILSHVDDPEILKDIAMNASDAGMRYACEMKKPVLPHEPGSRWSFTQAEAAKRIPDRGVLAELLVRNGFRPELLALFEDCPQK